MDSATEGNAQLLTLTLLRTESEVAKQTERLLSEQAARQAQQRTVELPLVREIFVAFDADADGLLSKEEYTKYLRGIAAWGKKSVYTDEKWDER